MRSKSILRWTALLCACLMAVMCAAPALAAETRWTQLTDGSWTLTDETGHRLTGWQNDPETHAWYFLDGHGIMQTGWIYTGGDWYYLGANGIMCRGWQRIGADWYFFGDDGAMRTGWVLSDSVWYHMDESGIMQTGWQKVGEQWHYFTHLGAMCRGWLQIGSDWFYFNGNGAMRSGWFRPTGGDDWYFGIDVDMNRGVMLTDTFLIDGDRVFYLGSDGRMATSPVAADGVTLPVGDDGALDLSALSDTRADRLLADAYVAGEGFRSGDIRGWLDPNKPMVALTFDDGPSVYTEDILDLLDTYSGRATFFVVGSRLGSYESVLQRIAAQGSEIGNHSWSHPQLPNLSDSSMRNQLANTNDAIYRITGKTPVVMRPPYGSRSQRLYNVCRDLDMAVIMWSIDTLDWEHRNADKTYRSVMNNVRDGSIILCHDIHAPTGKAMAKVIPALASRGYQLVTVSELLYFKEGGAVPGQVYRQG